MNIINDKRKNIAIAKVRSLLSDGCIFLDLETSGVGTDAEILQVGIVSHTKEVICNHYVKPQRGISKEATAKNGITIERLIEHNARPIAEVLPDVMAILSEAESIVIYHANFDQRILAQNGCQMDIEPICLMMLRRDIEGGEKFSPLNGNHDAIGDCLAAVELLHILAAISYAPIQLPQTVEEIGAVGDLLVAASALRLQMEKEETILKAVLGEALEEQNLTQVRTAGGCCVTLELSITKVRLNNGVTFDEIEALDSALVDREPRLKSAALWIKKRLKAGGTLPANLLNYEEKLLGRVK
jgi:DNA polymerase III epsilon subunit-like protein